MSTIPTVWQIHVSLVQAIISMYNHVQSTHVILQILFVCHMCETWVTRVDRLTCVWFLPYITKFNAFDWKYEALVILKVGHNALLPAF